MSLLEQPLFSLRTYFEDNLQTHIDAINAQVSQNKISNMKAIEVGRFTGLTAGSYPVMNIIPDLTTIEPLAQGYDDMSMVPVIYIADRIGDSEASYLKLFRYAQAVRDALVDDSTGGGAFDWITVNEIRPYPADANNIAIVIIRCDTAKDLARS